MIRFGFVLLLALSVPAMAQDAVRGKVIFDRYCAACHGQDAAGHGDMAAILTVLTPDLRMLSARNNGRFPLIEALRKIDGRDPMLAHGGQMPLYGDLLVEGADVALSGAGGQPVLTPRPLADLVVFLHAVQK